MRDLLIYAYVLGCYERIVDGDGFGRTHATKPAWNEAYDSGANLAEWVLL